MATLLRTGIAAPPARPPRYGLLAAAPVVKDPDLRWMGSFDWAPELYDGGGRANLDCIGGTIEPNSPTGAIPPVSNPSLVDGDPFVVWGEDTATTRGHTARDAEGRAQRQLAATESYNVADELWGGTLRDAESLANRCLVDTSATDTVTEAPATPIAALACLDFVLGRVLQGGQGMIHMTRQLLILLAQNQGLIREGSLWTTATGNLVVADAGYSGDGPGQVAGETQFMYGTSMIQVHLGPVEMFGSEADQIDRSVNEWSVIAQRVVAYQFDQGGLLAAEVATPVCTNAPS